VLGPKLPHIRNSLARLLTDYPDHRRNMLSDLLNDRGDIRQRSHAGFVGYHKAQFSYPYLDKRLIEFCIAVDGKYKLQSGVNRRLLRLGMEGLVPQQILSRTDKAPFSPDYHLRFQRQRSSVVELFNEWSGTSDLGSIVDFERVSQGFQKPITYQSENPMRVDFDSQFVIPNALFLCYFLNRFGR